MRLAALVVLVHLLAFVSACARPGSSARDPSRGESVAQLAGPDFVGDYTARWDVVSGDVFVEARLARGAGAALFVDLGAERWVRDAVVGVDHRDDPSAPLRPLAHDGRAFIAPECAKAPCRVRYRYALREAARSIDDVDVASEEGETVEAPPSTWLLAPFFEGDTTSKIRFRVETSDGSRFVTGVYPSSAARDAWDISLDDLRSSPYSAFGTFRSRVVDVNGARLAIAIAPGKLAIKDDELVAWAETRARAVAGYFGRFPLPYSLVLFVPSRGGWVGGGRTLAGGGGTVLMRVGERATTAALADDWVLVHELIHLAFPSVSRSFAWAEEGLATYVEPFVRARAGFIDAERAWSGLVRGLPNGLPAAGDRGLDQTPTWGRTYWGGALFFLLADVEIRKRTDGRLGLEDALRGILAEGGNNAVRWDLDRVFAAGDRATGLNVLRELHERMGSEPSPVDLGALFGTLGLVTSSSASTGRPGRHVITVRFEEAAPLADVRRAITLGRPGIVGTIER
ncbi:hypothetical protein AKJ09_02998 [Labilithrix luteola]|uniref:Peptidase M61 catalytic domain-containing protein n=1 Tax=Labilithrix luteola TaxID=1391654 RepID=A0A0K1PT76_9BACT|nr:hypothetical protein [Labilithrix luteola]AKU96334.1 hypothetical protein AKJ09_02998 [Labilithrix luteola]